jgi:hypothetical protein
MTTRSSLKELPHMLYADNQGRIHDHPHLRMTGFQGLEPGPVSPGSLVEVPAFSKLFYMPGCPPVGLDPATGRCEVLEEGPGGSDREAELEALMDLVARTGVQFIHLKNLCIDPIHYLSALPEESSRCLGVDKVAERLQGAFPHVSLGYFNRPVRD